MKHPGACARLISAVLSVAIIVQPFVGRAAATDPSVVVAPILDNDSEDDSRAVAREIAEALRFVGGHPVVDSDLAASVLDYHDGAAVYPSGCPEAASLMAAAKEHYLNFRSARAISDMDRAIALLDECAAAPDAAPLMLEARISQALFLNSAGKRQGARESLAHALSLNPLLDLPAGDYPPSLTAMLRELRSESGDAAGSLSVVSVPEGAQISINGIPHGTAPLLLEGLPPGAYRVSAGANRYETAERTVELSSGARADLKLKLAWARGGKARSEDISRHEAGAAVREGVRIAEALKADRAVLVQAQRSTDGSLDITARTVDRALRAGFAPLVVRGADDARRNEFIARLVSALSEQVRAEPGADPAGLLSPAGEGDPVILARRKRPLARRPLFWCAVGAAAAGAIVGGVLAAMGGSPSEGSIKVSFR